MRSLLNNFLAKRANYLVLQLVVVGLTVGSLVYFSLPQLKMLATSYAEAHKTWGVEVVELPKPSRPVEEPPKIASAMPEEDYQKWYKHRYSVQQHQKQTVPRTYSAEPPGAAPVPIYPAPTSPPPVASSPLPDPPETTTGSSGKKQAPPKPGARPGLAPRSKPPALNPGTKVILKTEFGDTIEMSGDKFLDMMGKGGPGVFIVVEKEKPKKSLWDSSLSHYERFIILVQLCSPFVGGFVSIVIWRKNRRLQRLTQEKLEKVIHNKEFS